MKKRLKATTKKQFKIELVPTFCTLWATAMDNLQLNQKKEVEERKKSN